MSSLKIGTIVMLRSPLPLSLESHSIVNGAIGEVSTAPPDIVGQVVVDFPQYPSWAKNKLWECKPAWLIPLSDPDMDLSEDTTKNVDEDLYERA